MKFNAAVIKLKKRWLDSAPLTVARKAAEQFLQGAPIRLTPVQRPWNPGGGSQLFVAGSDNGESCFIKVKHRSILVESALESEPDFSQIPSLENECNFLRELAHSPHVPRVLGFAEIDDYLAIATESLAPFPAVQGLSPVQIVEAFRQLYAFVRVMFEMGMVHTDIHEKNICFRDDATPVLIDFEEARHKKQMVPFESSLDVTGHCGDDTVGEFPVLSETDIPGYTCLQRLKDVFRREMKGRLPSYLAECNFDNSSSYNLDAKQQPDERIYQSVNLPDCRVEGQRPLRDERLKQVNDALVYAHSLLGRPLHVVDLGSNMGMTSFFCADSHLAGSVIGLEADARYVEAAGVLSFYSGHDQTVDFTQYLAGAVPYSWETDVLLMLSVYHHISDKDAFLRELGEKKIPCILCEFATQARYYPQRGNVYAEIEHIRKTLHFKHVQQIAISDDYKRPMIVFHNGPQENIYSIDIKAVNFYREEPFNALNQRLLAAARDNDILFLLKHITDQDSFYPDVYPDELFENRPTLQLIYTYISRLPRERKTMIVDIACGNCSLLKKLQDSGHSVAGVDISPVRILQHQKEIPDLRLGCTESLPLPDNCADIVIATEIFEHCFNLDDTLRECRRILKDNGRLFITVPLGKNNDGYNHLRHFTVDSLGKCLISINFEIMHIDVNSYITTNINDNIFCIAVKNIQ
ncbi:MAG: methyltransferase domain-containing protein [Desulfovibrio sp.]|jgi:SAM-dependent methyltransferase|nr:methyltransferase domain-containing protein [Desulfovibrio sp.]